MEDDDIARAERRWRAINAQAAAQPCPCGRPWTKVQQFPKNVGAVPVNFYRCDDCYGSVGFSEGAPIFAHSTPCPMGEDLGSVGPVNGPPQEFHCPHRSH